MPIADLKHCQLHYRLDGPPGAPVLVLSNALGTDLSLWDAQVPVFTRHFRVLRYDTRGHGQSSVSSEPTTIASLVADIASLLGEINADCVYFCGISLGGVTGMALALQHPERLRALVLSNTAAQIGTAESWNSRISAVRTQGMLSIVEPVTGRWFTPEFRSKHSGIVDHFRARMANTSPEGYIQCCVALRDTDLRQSISGIRAPTLIVAGSHDPATPPEGGQFLADKIAGAAYTELAVSHLSNVEAADEFAKRVTTFLLERELFGKGMAARRDVLGDAHVDRSLAHLSDFNREFQDLITRYAWGEIWNRPGLPRRTRSLLTIAMMVALNRTEEFRMHVRAAFNNGVTREEIKELLLQTAIYCGVPAANAAFRVAEEAMAEMDQRGT